MILFSQRKLIERLFCEWCDEYRVAAVPSSMIVFLLIKGWLNEDAIRKDLHQITQEEQK
jgi:hypothetical protein